MKYLSGDLIQEGDLILVDFGNEECVVVKVVQNEDEKMKYNLGSYGVFVESGSYGSVLFLPEQTLIIEGAKLISRGHKLSVEADWLFD